jgi:hypothetical protein
MGFHEDIV